MQYFKNEYEKLFRGCLFGPHSKKACIQLCRTVYYYSQLLMEQLITYCTCGCENMYCTLYRVYIQGADDKLGQFLDQDI